MAEDGGGASNPLALPDGLAEKMVAAALDPANDISWNDWGNWDRGTTIENAIDNASYTGSEQQQAEQKSMATMLGAYIALLDDAGSLEANKEAIIAIGNGTATAKDYAGMFSTFVQSSTYGISSDEAKETLAFYLNNLPPEQMSSLPEFFAEIETHINTSNISYSDNVIADAVSKMENPTDRAVAEYTYTYFKDKVQDPSKPQDYEGLQAYNAQMKSNPVDYADSEVFKEAFANDPKAAQNFLKWVNENDPDVAKQLADELGVGYLQSLQAAINQADGIIPVSLQSSDINNLLPQVSTNFLPPGSEALLSNPTLLFEPPGSEALFSSPTDLQPQGGAVYLSSTLVFDPNNSNTPYTLPANTLTIGPVLLPIPTAYELLQSIVGVEPAANITVELPAPAVTALQPEVTTSQPAQNSVTTDDANAYTDQLEMETENAQVDTIDENQTEVPAVQSEHLSGDDIQALVDGYPVVQVYLDSLGDEEKAHLLAEGQDLTAFLQEVENYTNSPEGLIKLGLSQEQRDFVDYTQNGAVHDAATGLAEVEVVSAPLPSPADPGYSGKNADIQI